MFAKRKFQPSKKRTLDDNHGDHGMDSATEHRHPVSIGETTATTTSNDHAAVAHTTDTNSNSINNTTRDNGMTSHATSGCTSSTASCTNGEAEMKKSVSSDGYHHHVRSPTADRILVPHVIVKKRKSALAPTATTIRDVNSDSKPRVTGAYDSRAQLSLHDTQKATATLEWDTERDRDARSILERNEAIGKAILSGELERGVYRGMGAFAPAINRREGAIAASKRTGVYGPVRGSSEVRSTMRIDYNPEICKDYKETGYCGYGDTCKFLHDRTDYKSGWQLEKEYEEAQKRKQEILKRRTPFGRGSSARDAVGGGGSGGGGSSESGSDDDDTDEGSLPFACLSCKQPWTMQSNPVVTKCNHYFCERCAMQHYAKSSKCKKCGDPTDGIFNSGVQVLKRVEAVVNPTAVVSDNDDSSDGDDTTTGIDTADTTTGIDTADITTTGIDTADITTIGIDTADTTTGIDAL